MQRASAPSSDTLEWNAEKNLLWAVNKDPKAFNTKPERFVLGHSTSKHFFPGAHFSDFVFHTSESSTLVRNGKMRLNGNLVNPVETNFPKSHGLLSLVTTGPVEADNVSKNGPFYCSWQGDIAEILIYSRPLGDSERVQVEAYLGSKYAIALSGQTSSIAAKSRQTADKVSRGTIIRREEDLSSDDPLFKVDGRMLKLPAIPYSGK